jgi:hypothetical protein
MFVGLLVKPLWNNCIGWHPMTYWKTVGILFMVHLVVSLIHGISIKKD